MLSSLFIQNNNNNLLSIIYIPSKQNSYFSILLLLTKILLLRIIDKGGMNETTNDEQIDSEIQRLENRLLYYPSIHNKNKDDNIHKKKV